MASHPDDPAFSVHSSDNDVAPEIPDNAGHSFTDLGTNYALDYLHKDPTAYLSGNGFKVKAFTEISVALKKRFPTHPIRSKDAVGNHLRYVKQGYGDKYSKCFKKPCPYYNRLAELFGGNKATSDNVLHLTKSKSKKSKSSSASASASISAFASTATPSLLSLQKCGPLQTLENNAIDIDSDAAPNQPPSPKPYDDELLPPPAKRRHLDDESENIDDAKTKAGACNHARSASASSSSGGRRASRNAETGSEIAWGLKAIGQGMSPPIITKADTSYVDEIVDALVADPTLLPDDPDGEYYALFLDVLSARETRARIFIKAPLHVQRIAMLKRVLTEKEMEVPFN
ncbi:hypothetical protein B0H11DRAFT_2256881 [Mycena galericulata]|nr:hypothetical protein B0H11DRAFT_2256881 [Mycena galericulata]